MAAGDILAVRVASATRDNGWVAEIDISSPAGTPGITGSYTLGLGTNGDPTAAKIVLTVTSPGYDSTGGSTTVPRTVYGTMQVRKASPNQTVFDEALVSTTLTVRVALSDFVYSGDTVTAVIGAGFYSQGGTPNAAFSGSVTNSSTLTHPKVIGRWAWPGYESFQTTIPLEAVIVHRSGKNGKPVAAVVFTVTDGSTTKTVTSAAMVKTVRSGDQGRGVILVYTASFNASDFTQGAVLTANFAAYPQVGDSGSVLDTSAGTAPPSAAVGPLKLLCDKTGAYGGGCAVVDSGAGHASTATTWVTATQALAETAYASSTANSYTTIGNAVQAIKSYNNANLSRNNPGGGVILLTGNHSWPGTSPGAGQGSQDVWLTITRLSTKPRLSVAINASSSTTLNTDKVKIGDVQITGNSGTGLIFAAGNTDTLWVDNCLINITGGVGFYQWKCAYATRNTVQSFASSGVAGFVEFSTDPTAWALVRGNAIYSTGLIPARDFCLIGNYGFQRFPCTAGNNSATLPTNDGGICAFNVCYDLTSGNDFNAGSYNGAEAYSIGYAFVQNVLEKNTGADALIQVCADGRTGASTNILFWHNAFIGERLNLGYNDAGTTAVAATNYSIVGNIFHNFNTKDDVFIDPTNGAQAGRIGNWSVGHGVGFRGNYRLGTYNDTGNTYDSWFGEFPGLWCNDKGTWGFVADYSNTLNGSGGAATVGGNYKPRPFSIAYRLLPAGQSPLPYDITGLARSAAAVSAGAYEVEDAPRGRFVQPPG